MSKTETTQYTKSRKAGVLQGSAFTPRKLRQGGDLFSEFFAVVVVVEQVAGLWLHPNQSGPENMLLSARLESASISLRFQALLPYFWKSASLGVPLCPPSG